ncbi:uncharacterized protein LOC132719877 [Ruditapes philippinarum]|uniref:uncharacterized protein LOC132719877 n=1 Tax=Ruditapes philippinarum TaxID=129788 RepID=UPI00295AD59E|nr:uncharacterized protein LOC132719877 [Ruditapes philippinarum]
MRNTASAHALSFFTLCMSVCLLYSSFVLKRDRLFDGYTCSSSKRVFRIDKVYTNIQCAVFCKSSLFCDNIFYQKQNRRCDGCRHFAQTELETADGSLYFTRGDCGVPSSIAYGNISLNSGTHFMDTAIVNCDPRFRADSDRIKCKFDGKWETAFCREHDCFVKWAGTYNGWRNITEYGNKCERWADHTDRITDPSKVAWLSTKGENYCRLSSSKWYTLHCVVVQDSKTIFQNCGVYKCA